MELLLAQIAARCRRNVTRARQALAYCRERGDQQGVASAEADLVFSGAVARAVVVRLHDAHQRGEVDSVTAARVGVDLVATLRLVDAEESAPTHTTRVMAKRGPAPYHRLDLPETLEETEILRAVRTFADGAPIGRSSDG